MIKTGAINVLPKQIAELIAAGEVIERPSSVIKELVENCIDAGAHNIIVEIQNGGTTYMRVTDDGCGIEREDVKNAFLRHATSKISKQDDLDAIGTLGFRGEALASICAVSKVEIFTKSSKESDGTHYALDGGEEAIFEMAGCPQGTTFIVRDIFYNVPARMKFLKKDVSEGNAIAVLIDRIALSHPEISFTLIRDGKRTLKTQGDGKLSNAVFQVFGKEFYASLVPVSYSINHIDVEGFVTKPASSVKANRSMQVFFINGRYVRTKTAMAALEQAYSGSIMTGKYPSCVLMLKMNCSMLDVNVHPAKLEVRFTNERPVYEAVYHAARSAVMKFDTRTEDVLRENIKITDPKLLTAPVDTATQLGFSYGRSDLFGKMPDALHNRPSQAVKAEDNEPEIYVPPKTKFEYVQPLHIPTAEAEPPKETEPDAVSDTADEAAQSISSEPVQDGSEAMTADDLYVQEQNDTDSTPAEPEAKVTISDNAVTIVDEDKRELPFRYIGQAFSTYIILEYDDDRLMFIDKHAAHERLIYERLKRQNRGSNSQMLLEPVSVILEKDECRTVLENKDMLMDAGFEIDAFGDRTVIIRSVPIMMETLEISEEFSEIADYLCKHKKLILSEKMEWIFANTACRAAVKAGNVSHPEELIDLALTLERNPEIRYCPHGRPIYFFMSRYEIEKSFKRI